MALDDGWMVRGNCWGIDRPDIFFPEKQKGIKPDTREAKKLCKTCPVKVSCLFYAVAHIEQDGVWGGFTERERRRIPLHLRLKMRAVWFKRHPTATPKGGKPRQERTMAETG